MGLKCGGRAEKARVLKFPIFRGYRTTVSRINLNDDSTINVTVKASIPVRGQLRRVDVSVVVDLEAGDYRISEMRRLAIQKAAQLLNAMD